MSGNVKEWTNDPRGTVGGQTIHVIRGGSLLVQLATAQETAGWVDTARATFVRASSLDPRNTAAAAGVTRNRPAPSPVVPTAAPTVP